MLLVQFVRLVPAEGLNICQSHVRHGFLVDKVAILKNFRNFICHFLEKQNRSRPCQLAMKLQWRFHV